MSQAAAIHGRLVDVQTAFHREALKPGGVDRRGAMQTVKTVLRDIASAIEQRLEVALTLLLVDLPNLAAQPDAAQLERLQACSNDVRDLAGLVERHLLTETATAVSDVLDAIAFEQKHLERSEALVFVEALRFAQLDAQRGVPITPYAELLGQLKELTTHVVNRASRP